MKVLLDWLSFLWTNPNLRLPDGSVCFTDHSDQTDRRTQLGFVHFIDESRTDILELLFRVYIDRLKSLCFTFPETSFVS